MSYRKVIQYAVTLGLLTFVGMLLISFGNRSAPLPPTAQEMEEASNSDSPGLKNASLTHVAEDFHREIIEGQNRLFQIRAARTLGFRHNKYELEEVTAYSYRTDGTYVRVDSDHCYFHEMGTGEIIARFKGNVRVHHSDGMVFVTERLEYHERNRVAWTKEPVVFGRGNLYGRGRGFRYDMSTEKIEVLEDAWFQVTPERSGIEPILVRCRALQYERLRGIVHFEGHFAMSRPRGFVESDRAVALLSEVGDDHWVLDVMLASGHVRSESHPVLRTILTGGPSPPRREMRADRLEITFDEDGDNPREMLASGSTRLRIEMSGPAGEDFKGSESLRSDRLEAAFFPRTDILKRLVAHQPVVISVIKTGEPRPTREVITGDSLNAGLDSEREDLSLAEVVGHVTYREGDLFIQADRGRYDHLRDRIALDGRAQFQMKDDQLEADRMDYDRSTERLVAIGNVRTRYVPDSSESELETGGETDEEPVPTMFLEAGTPVFFKADRAWFDRIEETAVYRDHASCWQGENIISAEMITIASKTSEFRAEGDVKAIFVRGILEDPGAEVESPEDLEEGSLESSSDLVEGNEEDLLSLEVLDPSLPVEVSAPLMSYRDEDKMMLFSRGVIMTQGPSTLSASEMSFHLSGETGGIELVEARKDVRLQQLGRSASADEALFYLEEQKFILKGRPATITDNRNSTQGNTLTILPDNDSILVESGVDGRTETGYAVEAGGQPGIDAKPTDR